MISRWVVESNLSCVSVELELSGRYHDSRSPDVETISFSFNPLPAEIVGMGELLSPQDHDNNRFYLSARWARRGIVVPFVRLRRRRTHSFGYYTNMVQQIKFIQTVNPSLHFFLPKVEY